MNNKKSLIIASSLIIGIFVLVTILVTIQNSIKKNPPGTVGNTAGNLNNLGIFCEADGKVYFANPYDKNSLYVMNSDETQVKKLSNAQANYINVGGNYIYYYQADSSATEGLGFVRRINGVFRANLKGDKATCLKRDPSGIISLIDNSLFYQHYNNTEGMTLYRVNTDKSKELQVASYIINPASSQNGIIYFHGMEEDHHLYSLNTVDNTIATVWEGEVWNPIVQGDYVYYMDVTNNYCLSRYSLSTNTAEILTTDRVDTFNLYNNYIYYQKNSETEPALKRILTDGSQEEIITTGNYEHINITSQFVYFNAFNAPSPIYKTPTEGSISVTTFDAASTATLENIK